MCPQAGRSPRPSRSDSGQGSNPRRLAPAETVSYPAWIRCPDCDSVFCTIHRKHTDECACPEIDEWKLNPYQAGGRALPKQAGSTKTCSLAD
jgi:hypothetical protein